MRYIILFTFAFLLFLIPGCIKENFSACPTVTHTIFTYSFEFNSDNKAGESASKTDLYIFDNTGILTKHMTQVNTDMTGEFSIAVDLNHGTYTVVMYGSTEGNNEVATGAKQGNLTTTMAEMKEGESDISELRLMLTSLTGYTDKDLGVVLHGMIEQCVITSEQKTYKIPCIRNTHVVELNINNLENVTPKKTRSATNISARIEGGNKAYLYDNSLDLELGRVSHAPYWQGTLNRVWTARYSVMRLFKEYPMTLKIYNGNDLISELNLTEEILKSPDYSTNEDLDKEDTFVITLEGSTAGGMTIMVNGWTTTNTGETIG